MAETISRSRLARPDSTFLVMLLWWSTWVVGPLGVHLVRLAGPSLPGESAVRYHSVLDVTSVLLVACAAILLIILIRAVTNGQIDYARRLAEYRDDFEEPDRR